MTITVDQQKLVLNAFAATFQNNMVATDLVTWKKFDGEMNDRNGLSVSEQVGPRYAVTQTVSGVQDLSSGVQDSVFGSEQFTVNRTFGSSMGWADFVKIRDIGEARESVALKNAATNLSEAIDSYIMQGLSKMSNNWVGAPANAVSHLGDITAAYVRLKKEGVSDEDLRAVLTYDDQAALADTIMAYTSTDTLGTEAFRKGFAGTIAGIPTVFTQNVASFTAGARGTTLVNGASQGVNYKDVAISGANGQYKTQTLVIDGVTASGTIKKGDVFTIANVYAYDNRNQQANTHLQQFTVVSDVAADGSGNATLRIFPAIIVPGSGSGGDVNVNTAHATVNAAPADNAAITFVGTAAAVYKPRLLLSKTAAIVNTADLIMPATGTAMRKALTRVPLSVRMWQDSDFNTGAHRIRFDVALSLNVYERPSIIRVNGQ